MKIGTSDTMGSIYKLEQGRYKKVNNSKRYAKR
jgi:hypothetical protein